MEAFSYHSRPPHAELDSVRTARNEDEKRLLCNYCGWDFIEVNNQRALLLCSPPLAGHALLYSTELTL